MSRYAFLAAALGVAGLIAAAPDGAPKMSEDEKAIRAAADAYVAAYNRGDLKGVVESFADDIEIIDEHGDVTRGKKAVAADLKARFAEESGNTLALQIDSLRFPKPDMAIERGNATVTSKDGQEVGGVYSAIHVKRDGKWKIVEIHETVDVSESAVNPLEKLAWLIGDWKDEDAEATVSLSYRWINDRRQIAGKYSVRANDEPEINGTFMIAWDPATRKVRSWIWDSTGTIGEGSWTEKEGRWVVKYGGTRADGDKVSSLNVYTPIDRNSYAWKSVDREVDGRLLPNIGPVRVVRDQAKSGKNSKEQHEDKE